MNQMPQCFCSFSILPDLFVLFLHLINTFPYKQKIKDKKILDRLFTDLDQNGDLEIDFKEFVALIAMVTSACHEIFNQAHKH